MMAKRKQIEEEGSRTEEVPLVDELFVSMMELITSAYHPANHLRELKEFVTTEQIWEKMQEIYPSLSYSQGDVARYLAESGFKMTLLESLDFVWLMKRY